MVRSTTLNDSIVEFPSIPTMDPINERVRLNPVPLKSINVKKKLLSSIRTIANIAMKAKTIRITREHCRSTFLV